MRTSIWLCLINVITFLYACGDSDSSTDPSKTADAFTAVAKIVKTTGTTADLTFEDGEVGAQYFIMPFSLGDTSIVNGGTENDNVIVSVKSTGASLKLFQGRHSLTPSPMMMSGRAFDHELRTLINRFDPKNPQSWERAKRLEDVIVTDGPYASLRLTESSKNIVKSLENLSQNVESIKAKKNPDFLNLQASACPSADNLAAFAAEPDYMDPDEVVLKADDPSYCLYVHFEQGLISETSIDKIKLNIETSLATYKKIYGDSFALTEGDYKFQPLVIVIPYGDEIYWPTEFPKVSAAFYSDATIAHGRPTIYVASDQSKVGTETNATTLTELFHSSIAHEMQHAILHYYRYTKGLSVDEPQFDEGIAHFMEDLMGYGEVNFPLFPGSFLTSFSVGLYPALPDMSGRTGGEAERGAAHALFYYLVSQKGGATFTDGLPNAGGGLDFIKTFVSGETKDIPGIIEAYGEDWFTVMGQYLGALAIDNATTVIEGDKYKVLSPQTNIKNTVGESGKTFGMRFHGHGGISDLKDIISNFTVLTSTSQDLDLYYYQTSPLLFTLAATTDTVSVSINSEHPNTGVSIVRIK